MNNMGNRCPVAELGERHARVEAWSIMQVIGLKCRVPLYLGRFTVCSLSLSNLKPSFSGFRLL